METKNKSFFAPSRMERATKLFICLFVFLLINCSSVFALSNEEIMDKILSYFNLELTTTNRQTMNNLFDKYQYFYVTALTNKDIYFFFTDNLSINMNLKQPFNQVNIWKRSDGTYGFTSVDYSYDTSLQLKHYFYAPYGVLDSDGNYLYKPGYETLNIVNGIPTNYKEPYFEWAGKKIGTTTLENFDGNIPCFYPSSFENYANSWASFKRIGYLYIDEEYILDNVFTNHRNFTIYNMSQTKSWTYRNDVIFTEIGTNQNGYAIYKINIELQYINTPYIYTMKFISKDTELANDIYINFVLLTEDKEQGSGGIIISSGDKEISGDFTKDETTLGDIENTITEPYNPNQNVLNNMDSGDILENLGYQVTEDPNADLWDTIINGLKETLTGSGNVTLELPLRSRTVTVHSDQIKQPENELKFFTGLFVNFWLLMQMFTFIKKTIDQINEGNLKVMHDVDADCYFF